MTDLTPRERRYARTRQAILDAARRLIAEQGLDRFSLRELARRVDYSPAGLYEYFGSKDEIVAAVTAEGFDRLSSYLDHVASDLPPTERLVEIGLAYVGFARHNPDYFTLMFTDLPSRRTSLAESVSSRSPYRTLLETVQAGIQAGELIPAENHGAEEIAYGLWSLVHGMATLELTHLRDFEADFEAVNRWALEVFLEGLKVK